MIIISVTPPPIITMSSLFALFVTQNAIAPMPIKRIAKRGMSFLRKIPFTPRMGAGHAENAAGNTIGNESARTDTGKRSTIRDEEKMADETNISWADHTHNHWLGCQKISPACDGCYAAHLMDTRMGRVSFGGPEKGTGTRALTSESNRKKPLKWNRKAKEEGRRPFVFCSSLSDVFDKHVDPQWRKDLFQLIRECDQLVWLLLTKRPQLIVKLSDEAGGLPPNAAIGTTVEDQPRADANLAALEVARIELQPIFTFGSFEPLLERVIVPRGLMPGWVITGGETDQGSHKARPSHPDWFRSLRDQAKAAGVPYHHKQNGEWISKGFEHAGSKLHLTLSGKIVTKEECPQHQDFPGVGLIEIEKVGKKKSGRTLDGKIHDAFPEV